MTGGRVHRDLDPRPGAALRPLPQVRLANLGRGVPLAPESAYLLEGDRLWDRSDAALRIARRLRAPWNLAYALTLFPRPLRDLVYRLIARNRHRWFGRREACPQHDQSLGSRLL